MTLETKKSKRAAYHDRQVAEGRQLVQFYTDAALVDRMRSVARRTGRSISEVYTEAASMYADHQQSNEIEAWRAVLAVESPGAVA